MFLVEMKLSYVLAQSIDPASNLSFGSTVKKEKDIFWAYKKGVELFAFDSITKSLIRLRQDCYKILKFFVGLQVAKSRS